MDLEKDEQETKKQHEKRRELIVDHDNKKVFYDKINRIYTKEFSPKLGKKIKYFLRFRKYPGENFVLVGKELNKLWIQTPEIIEYSKYKVVMKEIEGIVLSEYFENNKDQVIIENFLDIIVKILSNGIFHSDFAPRNFILKDGEISAIDLEGYMVGGIPLKSKKERHDRLQKALRNDEWVDYVEEKLSKFVFI